MCLFEGSFKGSFKGSLEGSVTGSKPQTPKPYHLNSFCRVS